MGQGASRLGFLHLRAQLPFFSRASVHGLSRQARKHRSASRKVPARSQGCSFPVSPVFVMLACCLLVGDCESLAAGKQSRLFADHRNLNLVGNERLIDRARAY